MPAIRTTPTQAAAPRVLYARKRNQAIRVAPANGGAMSDSPGTNFATIRALEPQRSKRDWVSLTQESGVNDIRHNSFMTPLPYTLPAKNQALSASTQAMTAPANNCVGETVPCAASAPPTISVGNTGTGRPIWFTSTLAEIARTR